MLSALLLLALSSCSPDVPNDKSGAEAAARRAGAPATQISGVATVLSADTIELHGVDARPIRLWGIAAPDRHARCGATDIHEEAALALSTFVARHRLACTPTGSDQYNRTTAMCLVNGADLGAHIVQEGWARDRPHESNGAYADEEADARAAPRGAWALQCQADVWGERR